MRRHAEIAEALKTFPTSIWGEPESRSWDPDNEAATIAAYRETIEKVRQIINTIAVLAEYEYPLRFVTVCIGASITVKRKDNCDPPVTVAVNEGLLDVIEPYMALNPDIKHSDDVQILCTLEATSEYLGKRLVEEIEFLKHITEEIDTENE